MNGSKPQPGNRGQACAARMESLSAGMRKKDPLFSTVCFKVGRFAFRLHEYDSICLSHRKFREVLVNVNKKTASREVGNLIKKMKEKTLNKWKKEEKGVFMHKFHEDTKTEEKRLFETSDANECGRKTEIFL